MANKGLGGFVVLAILIIIGIFFFKNNSLQSTFPIDPEIGIRKEYIIDWDDVTDNKINTLICQNYACDSRSGCSDIFNQYQQKKQEAISNGFGCASYSAPDYAGDFYYEDKAFIFDCGTSASINSENGQVYVHPSTGTCNFKYKKPFKGQEVAVVFGGIGFSVNGHYGDGDITKLVFDPDTLDPTKYDIFLNGENIGRATYNGLVISGSIQRDNSFERKGNSGFIKIIAHKEALFCETTPEEVWIRERFFTPFGRQDLSLMPTRYCQEARPFVFRATAGGEAPLKKAEGIDVISKGDNVPVPSNGIVEVNYATVYVSDLGEPCGINQVKEPIANGWKCVDFVKPVEVIVQCQQDSDCPQPLKDICSNYFIGCSGNLCQYDENALNEPICKNEVIVTIREIERVTEQQLVLLSGQNLFAFNIPYPENTFNFGEKPFKASIDFICKPTEEGVYSFPNPNPSCYTASVSFGGNSYSLVAGQEVKLKDNIKAIFFGGGKVNWDNDRTEVRKKESLSGTFIFNVSNPMTIDVEDTIEVLQKSNKSVVLAITNNLPSGNVLLKIRQTAKQSGTILPEIRLEKPIKEGINSVLFPMDTSWEGVNSFTIEPFYKIIVNGKEVLIPIGKLSFGFRVVTEYTGANEKVQVITVFQDREVLVPTETKSDVPTVLFVLGGLGALFAILKLIGWI